VKNILIHSWRYTTLADIKRHKNLFIFLFESKSSCAEDKETVSGLYVSESKMNSVLAL